MSHLEHIHLVPLLLPASLRTCSLLSARKLRSHLDNHIAWHRRHCRRPRIRKERLKLARHRLSAVSPGPSASHSLNFDSVDLHCLRLAAWPIDAVRSLVSESIGAHCPLQQRALMYLPHVSATACHVRADGAASVRCTTCMHLWLLPRRSAARPMYAAQEVRRSVGMAQDWG